MTMPGRKYSLGAGEYRYGFNGQENDKDISAGGQDFGERIYDGRLGKFLSTDPYYKNFPSYSPYMFAGNSPIKYVDEKGGYKIDGKIKSKYPLIYKYLSKNLQNEMLSSSLVAHGFKLLNPKLTDDNLKEIFTNGSGPMLNADKAPGFFEGAAGHYEDGSRNIEINQKIFSYVEGVLKNKKSTKEQKQKALLFLKQEIIHETGHDAERATGKMNKDGSPVHAEEGKELTKQREEINVGEAGNDVEYNIFKIEPYNLPENQNGKEIIPGIRPKNDKNRTEVLNKIFERLNSTEEGKQVIPKVDDAKK
jgi:RHS repeat-associated protein